MIIDCHGHYTTAPAAMRVFRALQISNMGRPKKGAVTISDDEIRASLENDNKPCLDGIAWLGEHDRKKIFEDNAKKAYPRLGSIVEQPRAQRVDTAR